MKFLLRSSLGIFAAFALTLILSLASRSTSQAIANDIQQPIIVDGGAPQEDVGVHQHDWVNIGHASEHAPAMPGMKRWQEQICARCGAKRFLEWPEHDCTRGKFDPRCDTRGRVAQ